jgi:hypothetical protein
MNIYEVIGLFDGSLGPGSQSIALTPLYLKCLKDFGIALLLSLGCIQMQKDRSAHAPAAFFFLLGMFLVSSLLTVFNQGITTFFVGLRWFLPVLLFYVFYNIRGIDYSQKKLVGPITAVFVVGLVIQIAQLFLSAGYFGLNSLGLSTRNPGFFLIPSTMASYTCFFTYYVWTFLPRSWMKGICIFILAPLSIFLTGSGSGILAFFAFLCVTGYFRAPRWLRRGFLFIAPLGGIALGILLPFVTQRIGIYDSLLERFYIVGRNIGWDNLLFSANSARGTNSANILNNFLGHSVIEDSFTADSTFTSIAANSGMLAAIAFFILVYSRLKPNSEIWLTFISLTSPFLFSTISFEVYPYNILFFLNLAYLCRITRPPRYVRIIKLSSYAPGQALLKTSA